MSSGRIITAAVEGIAPADAVHPFQAPLDRTVLVDRLNEVLATAGMETAYLRKHRTENDLVKADREQDEKAEGGAHQGDGANEHGA